MQHLLGPELLGQLMTVMLKLLLSTPEQLPLSVAKVAAGVQLSPELEQELQ